MIGFAIVISGHDGSRECGWSGFAMLAIYLYCVKLGLKACRVYS